MARLDGEFLFLHGQEVDTSRAEGIAGSGEGTEYATRGLGRTLDGTKVHHCLIEGGWLVGRKEFVGKSREEFFAFGGIDGCVDAEMTCKDSIDIAIDNGMGQTEGKGGNGSSGVVAHSLEGTDAFVGARETSHLHNLFGGSMEVAGTTVVAESLPQSQHFVLGGGSQFLDGMPAFHESLPIRPSLLYARLLQDDLTQPNEIRVGGIAPRQLTAILCIPAKQVWGK